MDLKDKEKKLDSIVRLLRKRDIHEIVMMRLALMGYANLRIEEGRWSASLTEKGVKAAKSSIKADIKKMGVG